MARRFCAVCTAYCFICAISWSSALHQPSSKPISACSLQPCSSFSFASAGYFVLRRRSGTAAQQLARHCPRDYQDALLARRLKQKRSVIAVDIGVWHFQGHSKAISRETAAPPDSRRCRPAQRVMHACRFQPAGHHRARLCDPPSAPSRGGAR